MDPDYDVIVLGGGGAGLAAATAAGEAGARVLLVEVADRLGGSTSLSRGVFYAAGTHVQQQAGIVDTPDAMFLYAMALNQYRMRASLLRRYCDEGAEALHWLMDMGVEFPVEHLTGGAGSSAAFAEMSGVPRCHAPVGHGAAITAALEASLQRHDIDIALRTRANRLLYEDGAVIGIEVDGAPVTASAVVVATGGFGADREMVDRYYPSVGRHGNETWYIGSQYCTGDAIRLGTAVGADLGGFDTGLVNVTPNLEKWLELPPSWIMLVNREGRRFMNEAVAYGVMSGLVDAQTGGECYGVLDAEAFANPPSDPRFAEHIRTGLMTSQWNRDSLDRAVAEGRLIRADTLDALAGKLDIRAETLRETVAHYNASAAAARDDQFFKDGTMMRPIGDGPYYGAAFRSAMICFTSTGLRIDVDARVLDKADRVIAGLYAAGEASSGVLGESYIGSGSSVAHVVTFGRIAGRMAAEQALSRQAAAEPCVT